jgi:hypothetical protein
MGNRMDRCIRIIAPNHFMLSRAHGPLVPSALSGSFSGTPLLARQYGSSTFLQWLFDALRSSWDHFLIIMRVYFAASHVTHG